MKQIGVKIKVTGKQKSPHCCYVCGKRFESGDKVILAAVGPDRDREFWDIPLGEDYDVVKVGEDCRRKYVPDESICSQYICN